MKMMLIQEQIDLQLSITQFKINVMDLVIIFVRKNPSSPMVLDLIVPLINIIRATPAKSITGQFVQKIIAFLKNRLPKMSEYPKEHDQQVIIDVYQAVYDFARSTSNSEMFDMCVQLSLYLRKCVLGAADAEITSDMSSKTRQEIEKLDAITITALEEYMTKKNTRYRKDIFVHPLQRSPFSSWPLLEALIQYINPAECINLFKHTQATQWITAVVQRTVAKVMDQKVSEYGFVLTWHVYIRNHKHTMTSSSPSHPRLQVKFKRLSKHPKTLHPRTN